LPRLQASYRGAEAPISRPTSAAEMPAVAARRQYRGTFGGTGTAYECGDAPTDWQTSTHGEGDRPMAVLAPRPHPRHGASGEGAGRGTKLLFVNEETEEKIAFVTMLAIAAVLLVGVNICNPTQSQSARSNPGSEDSDRYKASTTSANTSAQRVEGVPWPHVCSVPTRRPSLGQSAIRWVFGLIYDRRPLAGSVASAGDRLR
jgi:hypothetical protein